MSGLKDGADQSDEALKAEYDAMLSQFQQEDALSYPTT